MSYCLIFNSLSAMLMPKFQNLANGFKFEEKVSIKLIVTD